MEKDGIKWLTLVGGGLVLLLGFVIWKNFIVPSLGELLVLFQILVACCVAFCIGLMILVLRGRKMDQDSRSGVIPANEDGTLPLVKLKDGTIFVPDQRLPQGMKISLGAGTMKELLKGREDPPLLEAPVQIQPLPRASQGFLDLVSQIGPKRFFIGFDRDGNPVWARGPEELMHLALIGLSQRGKTNILKMLLAIYVLLEYRPVLFDGHGAMTRDVRQFFPSDVYFTAETINAAAARWLVKMDEDIDAYAAGKETSEFEKRVLFTDEWHRIYRKTPNLVTLESMCLAESAKINVLSVIAGQTLPAYMFGEKGGAGRDLFDSKWAVYSALAQCQYLGLREDSIEGFLSEMKRPDAPQQGLVIGTTAAKTPDLYAIPEMSGPVLSEVMRYAGRVPGRTIVDLGNIGNTGERAGTPSPWDDPNWKLPPTLPRRETTPKTVPLETPRDREELAPGLFLLERSERGLLLLLPTGKTHLLTKEQRGEILRWRNSTRKETGSPLALRKIPEKMDRGNWFYPIVSWVVQEVEGPLREPVPSVQAGEKV